MQSHICIFVKFQRFYMKIQYRLVSFLILGFEKDSGIQFKQVIEVSNDI